MCAACIAQQQGIALETALRKVSDPIGDLWFLVAEFARAATYLGFTKDALKAKVHMGRIPTVDLDKKLRFVHSRSAEDSEARYRESGDGAAPPSVPAWIPA
jgi:hypothetical protein